MADFCKQCSIEIFGEDFGDLANLGGEIKLEPGYYWGALCEGCGPNYVDDEGKCVSLDCAYQHGANDETSPSL